ncbi:MAG: ZIP family metal transporter [Bacteroidetes bacterium]|nr:ZIP family metal transporter [Bacteroidota bacterium]
MPFYYYAILFFTVFLSGTGIFLFKKLSQRFLKMLLAFSGAYLFGLCVLHLIPEVYSSSVKWIGAFVLVGFLLQIILEVFSEGIEHGHIHVHKNHAHAFPMAMIIGLCIHSFLEGMPLVQLFDDTSTQKSLLFGITLHHIPVALALMSMLLQSHISKQAAVLYLLLFAMMAPLGAFTSQLISDNTMKELSGYFDCIMAVVIGIFLHISTTILFENDKEHRFNYYKLIIIMIGAGLAFLSV